MSEGKESIGIGEQKEPPTYPETLELMKDFISNEGGEVRFDQYMQEHLFAKDKGFYSDRVDIQKFAGDFSTDALNPDFAKFISLYLQDNGHSDERFIELAGGDGTFKRNLLELMPSLQYLSIDLSPRLVAMQKNRESESNKDTILADALRLPLEDESVEGVIFANELLDALPCRVFKTQKSPDGRLVVAEEGVVSSDGQDLEFGFKPVEKDEFVEEYEEFLNSNNGATRQEGIASVSPEFKTLMEELNSVLKSGEIILFDYGFDSRYITMKRDENELPYFIHNYEEDSVENILAKPYETDITYNADFDFLKWLTNKANGDLEVNVDPQHHLFRKILEDKDDQSLLESRVAKLKPRTMGVLRAQK